MAGLSIEDPVTLEGAFTGVNVVPGDVFLLRGGTYLGSFFNKMVGTSENPLIVKPYNNERVIISGDFRDTSAQYVEYYDIEFTSERNPTAAWTDSPTHNLSGLECKYINCTFHDSNGGGFWDNGALFYGCITYNHGTRSPSAHGHSLYTQNQVLTHDKTIKHSIFGRSANYGLHGYSTAFSVRNIDIIENVLLPNNNHLIGAQQYPDDGILFQNNHCYATLQFGYANHDNINLTMTGNKIFTPTTNALQLHRYASGTISDNSLISGLIGGPQMDLFRYQPPQIYESELVMNNNSYYSRSGKSLCIATDGISPYWMNLATWTSLYGFDANSTMTLNASPSNSTHVYPNEYASVSKRKGLIVIWNWTEAGSVNVDLTTLGISEGTVCRLLQAQNPLVDVREFTMPSNKTISITMTGTVASVSGWTDPNSTFPIFGAFMVEAT